MKEVNYGFKETEVECDKCGASETIDSTDYAEINQELRDNGWVIKNIKGEWCEFCSQECYENYIKK